MKEAREIFNRKNSVYHKMGAATASFLEAVIGLETENLASGILN